MREKNKPFPFKIIDNFLSPSDLNRILEIYEQIEFQEKISDLFHFHQSHELKNNAELNFFQNELLKIMHKKEEETYLNFFASKYKKDNFLLPHDDMVERRIQAFTFYLEDCEDSKLAIYAHNCLDIFDKIDIKKNRLVIFDVQPNSFHEVENSYKGTRKAFTGWLNFRNLSDYEKHIEKFECIKFPDMENSSKNFNFFDLPDDLSGNVVSFYEGEAFFKEKNNFDFKSHKNSLFGDYNNSLFGDYKYLLFEDVGFPFIDYEEQRIGPVIMQRITQLFFKDINLPHLGALISCKAFSVKEFDFILAKEQSTNVIDLFIFECTEEVENKSFITYLDNESGLEIFSVPIFDQSMHIIKRENSNWFLQRSTGKFKFIHAEYEIN